MSSIKLGIVALAFAVVSAPSFVDAQNFTQRGTRNGAIAGAIVGGIIGDQRDNAFTGAVIGGLVGGAAGRAVGRQRDAQFYGGNAFYGGGFQQPFHRPIPQQSFYRNYNYGGYGFGAPSISVQRTNFYGGGYRYGGGGAYCPRRGW